MEITNVGLGTTSVGPITETGSVNIIEVNRGYIGSAATNHSANDITRLYSGSYNIVDSRVHFTEAPRGTNQSGRTPSNLDPIRSTFNGRVFLRKDYSKNVIFDDISDKIKFTISFPIPLFLKSVKTANLSSFIPFFVLRHLPVPTAS